MSRIDVVTGASSGVGRALCIKLADEGRNVLGLARRQGELDETRATDPDRIAVLATDLAEESGRDAVVAALAGRQVATLTHSAALAPHDRLQDTDLAAFRQTMAVNLEAPIFLTRALLPQMAPGARVLHLSSGSAYGTIPGGGVYSISKAALLMAKQVWNADLSGSPLVGSAMPGVVEGPMQDAAREADNPSAALFRNFKDSGMLIKPARVAEFLFWLLTATDDAAFVEGDWNVLDESHHDKWLKDSLRG